MKKTGIILLFALQWGVVAFLAFLVWWNRGVVFQETDGNSTSPAALKQEIFFQELATFYPQVFERVPDEGRITYTIPGVIQTVTLVGKGEEKGEWDIAEDMTPQGLAFVENMVAISAYSKGKKLRSVIWLLDKETGKYLKTVVLPTNSHVGGMAYDPLHQLLWVTTTDAYNTAQISALKLETIQQDNFSETGQAISFDHIVDLEHIERSSYMVYRDNALYVGYFDQHDLGYVGYFPLDEAGIPLKNDGEYDHYRPSDIYGTPEQVQGMAFFKDKIVFSQSYGAKDSKLLYFSDPGQEQWESFEVESNLDSELVVPEYLQQIVVDGDYFYLLFESSAVHYRKNPFITPMDRILKIRG